MCIKILHQIQRLMSIQDDTFLMQLFCAREILPRIVTVMV